MSHADESRLEVKTGSRHQGGHPYHYSSLSQEDRIRRVFALAEAAPLPAVSDQALATYYDYLATNLSLPFDALHCPTGGEMRQLIHYVHVTELMDPAASPARNCMACSARRRTRKRSCNLPLADLGVRDENPNCQLIDDYAYWFVNWR